MASRILPPFSQASRWPWERIVQHRCCASFRPADSASHLCRASARLKACFRIARKHRHGSRNEYFSCQIVRFSQKMILPLSCGSLFRPQEYFVRIVHCTLSAASIQRAIRGKHHAGRQHISHRRGKHRTGREVESVKNTKYLRQHAFSPQKLLLLLLSFIAFIVFSQIN